MPRRFEDALKRASTMTENVVARGAVDKIARRGFLDVERPKESADETLRREREQATLYRVVVDGDDGGALLRENAVKLQRAVDVRSEYFGFSMSRRSHDPSLPALRRNVNVTWRGGVATHPDLATTPPAFSRYVTDLQDLYLTSQGSRCVEACRQRLNFVQEISKMLTLLNVDIEAKAGLSRPGGIFATAPKVDNSVRLTRATPARELLDVVSDMFEKAPNEPITKTENGTNVTLADLVIDCGVNSPSDFTVAGLGWQPTTNDSARFDVFRRTDSAASHFSATIAEGALNTDGGLFPVLVRRLMGRQDARANYVQAGEYRIQLMGDRPDEVFKLARVFKSNSLGPYSRAMWFLRVGYSDHVQRVQKERRELRRRAEAAAAEVKKTATGKKDREAAQAAAEAPPPTVQDFLNNVFNPLFDATLRPEESGAVGWFLTQVGGIHIESLFEKAGRVVVPAPGTAVPAEMPYDDPRATDTYVDYYIWANMMVLNSLRARVRLNTFQLRRGIGGVAGLGPVLSGYMLCDVLTNAAVLEDHPVVQYLVGVHRIGATLSPMMNNVHGLPYRLNPLARMFHRSLQVAVATEAPMHYHHDANPLVEELGTAQKLLGLTGTDMAELARNSVKISSFPVAVKREWLGESGYEHLGSLSKYRIDFREEVWRMEGGSLAATCADVHGGGHESESVALWSKLSTVTDEEYFRVRDMRVRFPRTIIVHPRLFESQPSVTTAAKLIARALKLRDMYIWRPPKPWRKREVSFEEALSRRGRKHDYTYASKDSVFIAFKKHEPQNWPAHLCTLEQFHQHLMELKGICDNVDVKDLAYRRLEVLDYKFRLHLALNEENEAGSMEGSVGMHNRDFYHASKVDTHIHMAAGMTGRHLRKFILDKLQNNGDDIVSRDADTGKVMTFAGVAKALGVTGNLTVDQLNVQADHTLFQRFDNFNNKYNPMAEALLRTLLLKTDNYMNGRYFAEVINQTFAEYAKDQFTFAENRVSIYGSKLNEWDRLADWFDTHGMNSKHNKWIIQVPRVYKVFRANNTISSFGQYIENIFKPLWEVSMEPHRYPRLHNFLEHVSGFDSVDNEATIDLPFSTTSPWQWTAVENPPYNYYMYHLWANVRTLNEFRNSQGLSTFSLRPHCGESGSDEHLIGCFLTADAINHGVNLRNDPSLEYIYYLARVGLAVSPLSNNALFLYFLKNPFDGFFRRGLNVSLSTDDPLMFHQTREPLIEEYSIAAKVWRFSMNDLCEIARNSVLQSGYSAEWKAEKLGHRYFFSSSLGNDPNKSHMSNIRQAYRFEAYHAECAVLDSLAGTKIPRCMTTTKEENKFVEEEEVPHQTVVVSTQNEEMERLQRDIKERKDRIAKSRAELEDASRQHRTLVEQVSELGSRIAVLEDEVAELEKPAPKAEVSYSGWPRHQQRQGGAMASALLDLPSVPSRPPMEVWRDFLQQQEEQQATAEGSEPGPNPPAAVESPIASSGRGHAGRGNRPPVVGFINAERRREMPPPTPPRPRVMRSSEPARDSMCRTLPQRGIQQRT
jgi:AMP deaminase